MPAGIECVFKQGICLCNYLFIYGDYERIQRLSRLLVNLNETKYKYKTLAAVAERVVGRPRQRWKNQLQRL